MHARRFIRAMLAPHHAENAQLRQRRLSPKRNLDPLIFFRRDAVVFDHFRGNGGSVYRGHGGTSIFARKPESYRRFTTCRSAALESCNPVLISVIRVHPCSSVFISGKVLTSIPLH